MKNKKRKSTGGKLANGNAGEQAAVPALATMPIASPPGVTIPVPVAHDQSPAYSRAPGRRMSASAIARECGISRQRVQRLLAKGHLPAEIIESCARRKATAATLREDGASASPSSNDGGGSPPPLAESIRRKEASLATLRAIEVAQKRGELIPRTAAFNFFANLIIAARECWLSIADLGGRVRQCATDGEAQKLIDGEVRRGLAELEKYGAGLAGKGRGDD